MEDEIKVGLLPLFVGQHHPRTLSEQLLPSEQPTVPTEAERRGYILMPIIPPCKQPTPSFLVGT